MGVKITLSLSVYATLLHVMQHIYKKIKCNLKSKASNSNGMTTILLCLFY